MKFSVASILVSLIILSLSIKVNLDVIASFMSVDGKTKTFYELIELHYTYKYYFLLIILVSVIFLFYAYKKSEQTFMKMQALILLVLAFLSIFINIYKFLEMVYLV